MTRLATPQICTMTELRKPQKVFDRGGGQPIAIMKNSAPSAIWCPPRRWAAPITASPKA